MSAIPAHPHPLRIGIAYGNVCDLTAFSTGPQGGVEVIHRAVAEAGYQGLQGGDPQWCRQFGLTPIGSGLLASPADADGLAAQWKDRGATVVSCIAGFGMESDAEMDAYAAAICQAAADHKISLLLETHRASITQDAWRTVQLCGRFPQLRFTLDFSHWFTGQEMPYGDMDARLAFLQPVFDRTLLLHGRVGDRCCMQVPVVNQHAQSLPVFMRAWTSVMRAFISTPHDPSEELWFCPELLGPAYNYARQFRNSNGDLCEETDRWLEAKSLVAIAKQCYATASEICADQLPAASAPAISHNRVTTQNNLEKEAS